MRYILILRVNEKTHLRFGEIVLLTIWRLIKKTYDIEYILYWVFRNYISNQFIEIQVNTKLIQKVRMHIANIRMGNFGNCI